MPMYQGNKNMTDDWDEFFGSKEMYGSRWIAFRRDTDPCGRYLAIKVLADGHVENKANYWLSWDKKRSRLTSRGIDSKLLKDNRPELYSAIIKNLVASS